MNAKYARPRVIERPPPFQVHRKVFPVIFFHVYQKSEVIGMKQLFKIQLLSVYKQRKVDTRVIFSHLYGYWNQVPSKACQCTESRHKKPCVLCGGVLCFYKVHWFMRRVEFSNDGGDLIGGGWWRGVGGYLLGLMAVEGKQGRVIQYFTTPLGEGRVWKVPVTHGVHCFSYRKSNKYLVRVLRGSMRRVKACSELSLKCLFAIGYDFF